jgi:hypothetical protein
MTRPTSRAWSTSPTIPGQCQTFVAIERGVAARRGREGRALERHFRNRIALSIIPGGNPREHRKARRMPARANFSKEALLMAEAVRPRPRDMPRT